MSGNNLTGRAKKRIDDLERRLEICRRNYVQWGGKLAEDCRRIKRDRESARLLIISKYLPIIQICFYL